MNQHKSVASISKIMFGSINGYDVNLEDSEKAWL